MDEVMIVGVNHMDFTTQAGDRISGSKIYYEQSNVSHVEGVKTGECFIRADILKACGYVPAVGEVVQLLYNRFGKVQAVQPVKA